MIVARSGDSCNVWIEREMAVERVTGVPATLMEVEGTRDLERWTVVNQMASDLSGFNDMPFRQNQQCNADRQCSSWAMQAVLASDETEMNSCVSSAYCW